MLCCHLDSALCYQLVWLMTDFFLFLLFPLNCSLFSGKLTMTSRDLIPVFPCERAAVFCPLLSVLYEVVETMEWRWWEVGEEEWEGRCHRHRPPDFLALYFCKRQSVIRKGRWNERRRRRRTGAGVGAGGLNKFNPNSQGAFATTGMLNRLCLL